MGCPGCGGKTRSAPPTHGHILGCGAWRFPEDPRYNPLEMDIQERILRDAIDRALMKVKDPKSPAFAKALAEGLAGALRETCVEPPTRA